MLTQGARYALHAMVFLARKNGAATVAEIAEAESIPRKFLENILSDLRVRGLVVGKRGPTGGYHLAREAGAINFAEILRCIDGPLALAPCGSLTHGVVSSSVLLSFGCPRLQHRLRCMRPSFSPPQPRPVRMSGTAT